MNCGVSQVIYELLQYFTGGKTPKIKDTRDERRMFADEFSENEQQLLLKFFIDNKTLIVNDILKGRGKFSAEWMLVILKLERLLFKEKVETMEERVLICYNLK